MSNDVQRTASNDAQGTSNASSGVGESRLIRLEELVAHQERELAEFRQALAELHQENRVLAARVAQLEALLRRLAGGGDFLRDLE